MVQRELSCMRNPSGESTEQAVHDYRLAPGPRHDHDVNITRLPRLAPPLNRQPADHGVQPAAVTAEQLQLDRRRKQPVHDRR